MKMMTKNQEIIIYNENFEDMIRNPQSYKGKKQILATCPTCGEPIIEWDEQGREFSRFCKCDIKEIHRRRMAKFEDMSIIDRAGKSNVFENAKPESKEERELYKDMFLFAKHFNLALEDEDYVGFLFTGDVGNGKTFLANCICNKLREDGHTVVSFSLGAYLRKIQDSMTTKENAQTKLLEIVRDADMLFIDDLGSEKLSEDWGKATLFALIDERYRAKKPLLITTNLTAKQMCEEFQYKGTQKIVERIVEMCEVKNFTWASKRVVKRREKPSFLEKLKAI